MHSNCCGKAMHILATGNVIDPEPKLRHSLKVLAGGNGLLCERGKNLPVEIDQISLQSHSISSLYNSFAATW